MFKPQKQQSKKIQIQSPLQDERFLQSESINLLATVTPKRSFDNNTLQWSSDLDGALGQGNSLTINNLSIGSHIISVTGHNLKAKKSLRVFSNLDDFYKSKPAPGEITRIKQDFSINTVDGTGTNEIWNVYPPDFNQQSTDPSNLVICDRLDILRHQNFLEPLPFTNGEKIYEYFKTFVKTFELRLDCDLNHGGGGMISLNRGMSSWDARLSGSLNNPDACKTSLPNPQLYSYINSLYLLIHEERHNEPSDPGHILIGDTMGDAKLEGGSGYAWAALYTMWVYKYGEYDTSSIKNEAKLIAIDILSSRFPTRPYHSNPKVQAIIDELLPPA